MSNNMFFRILGVNFNATNLEKTVKHIENSLYDFKGKYICVSNVHTTVMAYENDEYNNIQKNAVMVLPDGRPLSIICNLFSKKHTDRVTGPDLMSEIFKISEVKGYTHFFYGSTEQTLNKLEVELKKEYPKLNICGLYSPPFRSLTKEEDQTITSKINACSPNFLWVGLGAPKQEIWMFEHKERIDSLMIGVGAGFDYFSKNIQRAPKWMQFTSLEWFYRFLQDPKRLWRRYLTYNSKFIFYIVKEFCKFRR